MIVWRHATPSDLPRILALLVQDAAGGDVGTVVDATAARGAFEAATRNPASHVIVGEDGGTVIATYQLSILDGISLGHSRRAQLEGVRVDEGSRSRGVGRLLLADAERRARDAGCSLLQLSSNAARDRAQAFYMRSGFVASHVGMKKPLR